MQTTQITMIFVLSLQNKLLEMCKIILSYAQVGFN